MRSNSVVFRVVAILALVVLSACRGKNPIEPDPVTARLVFKLEPPYACKAADILGQPRCSRITAPPMLNGPDWQDYTFRNVAMSPIEPGSAIVVALAIAPADTWLSVNAADPWLCEPVQSCTAPTTGLGLSVKFEGTDTWFKLADHDSQTRLRWSPGTGFQTQ